MSEDPKCHCWHVMGSYTDGLASAGGETQKCCHCGITRERRWRSEPDPDHGTYVGIRRLVYDDATTIKADV